MKAVSQPKSMVAVSSKRACPRATMTYTRFSTPFSTSWKANAAVHSVACASSQSPKWWHYYSAKTIIECLRPPNPAPWLCWKKTSWAKRWRWNELRNIDVDNRNFRTRFMVGVEWTSYFLVLWFGRSCRHFPLVLSDGQSVNWPSMRSHGRTHLKPVVTFGEDMAVGNSYSSWKMARKSSYWSHRWTFLDISN